MKKLEKRMYFFVPYNISPIQQAIQAGHASLEYARKYRDDYEFQDFADNWKTWIILNGGTTNVHKEYVDEECKWKFMGIKDVPKGDLDKILREFALQEMDKTGIKFSYFFEPDLNNALTAVCFIADERVFNYEKYPEFDNWFCTQDYPDDTPEWKASYTKYLPGLRAEEFPTQYTRWVKEILGGETNLFLRNITKGKKLA